MNNEYTMFNFKKSRKYSLAKAPANLGQILLICFVIYVIIDIQFMIYTAFTLSYLDPLFEFTVIFSIPLPVGFFIIYLESKLEFSGKMFDYINHYVNLHQF